MSRVPPECFSVRYNWRGEKLKSIFLSRADAEIYVAKMKLTDAIILPCWTSEDIEFITPEDVSCGVKPLDVATESPETDGTLGYECAMVAPISKQKQSNTQ